MVEITLLGEQSVVDPVTERILTRSSRSIALLGLLITHTGAPQTRSAIAGAFWPDSTDRQALTNLRRELHQLRRMLAEEESLEVTSTHLCWHGTERHQVDLARFQQAYDAAVAADGDDEDVLRHGTIALSEYSGDLLPTMTEPWLDDARSGLRHQCVTLCNLVFDAAERQGLRDVAADAMRKRIFVDRYDEPAYRGLMEVQADNGDRAGAVRTYRRLTSLLERELGVSPDHATKRTLTKITSDMAGDVVEDGRRAVRAPLGAADR